MCAPIAIGIATAVIGGITAVASYQQQQQQVEYANAQATAQADYQNRLSVYQAEQFNQQVLLRNQEMLQQTQLQQDAIANQNLRTNLEFQNLQQQRQYQTLQNQLQYQTELNKSLASEELFNTQLELNRSATSRAINAEQQKLRDAQAQAAFEGQRLMATNLQAQGSVLASGRTGQSIGLLVNDANRSYSQNAATLNRNIETAYGDYENNSAMAVLRQLNADADATSRLLPRPIEPLSLPEIPNPVYAQIPGFGPTQPFMDNAGPSVVPVLASGPSPIGLIGGIGGSILGGVNAGYNMAALKKQLD